MTPQEILLKAADILETTNITRGCLARDIRGMQTDPTSREAVCFCVIGLVRKVVGTFDGSTKEDPLAVPLRLLARRLHVVSLTEWNDEPGRTKEEVIAGLRAAAR